jgi:hypothetical protein
MIEARLPFQWQSTAGLDACLATATAELVGDAAAAPPGARNISSTAVVMRPNHEKSLLLTTPSCCSGRSNDAKSSG